MGDETHESMPSMPTKTSFISIEEADANAEPTPAFGKEPDSGFAGGDDSGLPRTATLSR